MATLAIGRAEAQAARDSTREFLSDDVPFMPFARPSGLRAFWPDNFWYEAEVNIPVPIWSRTRGLTALTARERADRTSRCFGQGGSTFIGRFGSAITRLTTPGALRTGCTFVFVPHFLLRQMGDSSAPVRTPTFNPGLEFNWYTLSLEDSVHYAQRRGRSTSAAREGFLGVMTFRLAHYSNGQAGCIYKDRPADRCSGIPGVTPLNTVDGSFSTHYFELGATGAFLTFDPVGAERTALVVGNALRYHPRFLRNVGGMDDELASLYGRFDASLRFMLRGRRESLLGLPARSVWAIEHDISVGPLRHCDYPTYGSATEASLALPAMYGFGVSARWVRGFDYYNIGFPNRLRNPRGRRFQPTFGVFLDHSRAISLTRAARRRAAQGVQP